MLTLLLGVVEPVRQLSTPFRRDGSRSYARSQQALRRAQRRTLPTPSDHAFVTLYTGGSGSHYLRSLMYMLYSLEESRSVEDISEVLVLVFQINPEERDFLAKCHVQIRDVQFTWLDKSRKPPPRWATFVKLEIFRLVEFSKITFLDVDGFANQNLQVLFNFPSLSAVEYKKKSLGGLRYYNTGVLVVEPSTRLLAKVEGCWKTGNYSSLWWGEENLTEQELLIFCLQDELHSLPEAFNCKLMYETSSHERCAFVHTKWWEARELPEQTYASWQYLKLHLRAVEAIESICEPLRHGSVCSRYRGWFKDPLPAAFPLVVEKALQNSAAIQMLLYSHTAFIWKNCNLKTALMENDGLSFHSSFCLWGNMLPHKLVTVLSLIHQLNISVVIESGRKGGLSAYLYSLVSPSVVSIELNPIPEVEHTLSLVAENVKLITGNGKHLVPSLVEQYHLQGHKVAVILDGPKGRAAASVVSKLMNSSVLIGVDDMLINSPARFQVEDLARHEVFDTSNYQHLVSFLGKDRKWARKFFNRSGNGHLHDILRSTGVSPRQFSMTEYGKNSLLLFLGGGWQSGWNIV